MAVGCHCRVVAGDRESGSLCPGLVGFGVRDFNEATPALDSASVAQQGPHEAGLLCSTRARCWESVSLVTTNGSNLSLMGTVPSSHICRAPGRAQRAVTRSRVGLWHTGSLAPHSGIH